MRTSHKKIHQMIADEKSRLTDAEIFSSKAYAAYLMDIVEVTTGRYKRKMKVITSWDEKPGADVAYTDNRIIYINCGNCITADYPTKELKHLSLLGLVGHEAGHVLYTDFSSLLLFMQAVDNGTMYPSKPNDLEDEEQEYLEQYLEVLKEKDQKSNCIIKYILHSIANILEDCYIEASMCTDFPGTFKTGITLNNVKLTEDSLSISYQIAKEIPKAAIITNLLLQYARVGEYNNDGGYKGEITDIFDSCIELVDDAVDKLDARKRYNCANRIFLRMWPYVKEWIEEIKSDPSKTPQEVQDMLDALEKELGNPTGEAGGSKLPSGADVPSKGRVKPDFSQKASAIAEAQDVLESEGGRFALVKTDDIDESGSGGVEYNNKYSGSGYTKAAADMERLMSSVAEDKAYVLYNEELEDELAKARKELDDAYTRLQDSEKELDEKQSEVDAARQALELAGMNTEGMFDDAQAQLDEARRKLEDGYAEYADAEKQLEAESADAQAEIADAQSKLDELKKPTVYLLDRNTNAGYASFDNDSNIVNQVAAVFPIFFFAVAALVCMTTMTRMVEDERTQIGVLKALGYSEGAVMAKYLFYSGSAAVGGSVFGYVAGNLLFPKVIWMGYGMLYDFAELTYVWDIRIGIISIAAAVLCSMGATYFSCAAQFHSSPAMLIRPKAPKCGKRILLERAGFIWKRLSFLK